MKRSGGAMLVPAVVAAAFLALGAGMWIGSGHIEALLFFGLIGTFAATGLALYGALPKPKKPLGRRLALILIGSLLVLTAIFGPENMQVEGFFFGLFSGITQAAVIHYLIAKLVGPVLFGRLWCGWACWTVMVFDLLPFQRSAGRLAARWGWLRYLHLALSLGVTAGLWYGLSYQGVVGPTALVWYLIGNALYYLVGIYLAFALKDNRAFCKYLCPVAVPLKLTSRLSLLKVQGDAELCTDCGVCTRNCPMDIRVADYAKEGLRVLSTECTLCQTCISGCSSGALRLTFRPDLGGLDLLRFRDDRSISSSGFTKKRPSDTKLSGG